jgi:hypothetical protein
MTKETGYFVPKEQMAELKRNFYYSDEDNYISLRLDSKPETLTLLIFGPGRDEQGWRFEVFGREYRQMTPIEIGTIVQVAKKAAPEALITKTLVSESIKELASRGKKLLKEKTELDVVTGFIESLGGLYDSTLETF